jgi:hypothetical protein
MKYKTLQSYTLAVNNLARKDCEIINNKPRMFKGVHHDFPERMMEYYWEQNYTPRQVLTQLATDAEMENAWEARVS